MTSAPAPAPLRVLCGDEPFLVDEAAREVWSRESAGLQSEMSTERLEGAQATVEAVRGALDQLPFLDPYRLVLVVDPPGLTPRRRPAKAPAAGARARRTAPNQADQLLAALLSVVEAGGATRCVLVLHQTLPAGSALDGVKGVEVRRFAAPRRRELDAWLAARVASARIRTELPAALIQRQVAQAAGEDLGRLALEIRKVADYAAGNELDRRALEALCPAEDQSTVFQLCDAILVPDVRERHRLLSQVMQHEDSQRILAMLARQLRLWLRIRELRDRGVRRSDLGDHLKGPAWMLEMAHDRVNRISTDRLQAMLTALADVDWEMKSGKRDSALGLEAMLLSQ